MMQTTKFKRVPVSAPQRQRITTKTFHAPIRGWVLNENLATAGPAAARQLDNWVPTSTGIRLRGGAKQTARVATGAPVRSFINYQAGSTELLFGASATTICDITTPVDVNVVPTPAVTGQTSGAYSYVQFANAGGNFLIAVNGADLHLVYDGTTWAVNTPSITDASPSAFTSADFSFVWAYKNRLFFVVKDTNTICYLPVDSIGGAVSQLSLDGVFKRGGSVMFGATWSLDAGDGLDDKCVIVSTLGEVAVYEGSNPSSSTDWALIGRYDITAPMGMKATMQAGGDLLVATEDGLVPISVAINKDPAALSLAAVSRAIEPYWKEQVLSRRTVPWEIIKWSANNMMVISQPATGLANDFTCLVANLETGAWCRFTGWDTHCLGFHKNYGYFGTSTGEVYQMEVGGNDGGLPYTAVYQGQPDHLNKIASIKTVRQARAIFWAASPFVGKVSGGVNYSDKLPTAPNSVADYQTDEWDSGLWDVARWDGRIKGYSVIRWTSIGKTGHTFAPQVQITCGVTPFPRVELVSVDFTYEGGGVVV